MGKDTDDPGKFPGMKTTKIWEIEKIRRESGFYFDPDAKSMPDPLPLDKLQEREERDGKVIHKVASKRMSLTEINALVEAFRRGDSKAEEILYRRYISRIRMYISKNKWSEYLDLDDMTSEVWIALREYLRSENVETSILALVKKIVHRLAQEESIKEKREQLVKSGNPSNNRKNEDQKKPSEALRKIHNRIDLYKVFLDHHKFWSENKKKFDEDYLNMRISFRKLIAKCTKPLIERHQQALDRYFFKGETMEEIGALFQVSHATISTDIKSTLDKLLNCFRNNGVLNLEAIV